MGTPIAGSVGDPFGGSAWSAHPALPFHSLITNKVGRLASSEANGDAAYRANTPIRRTADTCFPRRVARDELGCAGVRR